MSEINDFLDGKQSSEIDSFLGPDAPKPAGAIRKVADLGLSVGKGVIAVPEAAVGLANLVTGGHAGKLAESAGVRFKDAKDVLSGWQSDDFKGKQQQFQQADGILEKTGVALSNPSLIANTVAESLPLMGAGGVGARALLGAAPKIGAATAGAIGEGIAGAGSSGEQYRQESTNGLLTGKQAALASASGAATAAFGAAGGKLAQKLGIGDIDTMLAGGTTRVAAGAAPKGAIRRMAEGAASEGLLEELPQSLSEQGFQNVALDRPVTQGMEDAGVMGVLTGGAMGAGAGAISRAAQPPTPPPATPPTDGTTPPPAAPAGPVPALGYSPLAGTPTVFPDGSVALNGEQEFARRYAPQKPSEAMGLDPAAGPLSAAAVTAVDTGAHQEIQLQQANEADQAAYEQATAEQEQRAAELDTATKPITHGPIAEAAMSDDDKRAIMFSNKTVADGGIQYKGTLDGDILNGQLRPYKRWEEAIRRVKMEGKDWRVAKVQDGFVARRKDANGPSTDVQPGDTGSTGGRSTDSPASVGLGATDGNGVGAQSGRSPDAVLDQAGELPKRVDAAPVATTRAQPTTLGKQTTATAGLGFTAKDVTRVPNPAPRADTTPAAQAVEAPAVVESNAAASEGVPAAGSVAVEGDGIEPKAKWLKAINDQNRLAGDTGVQLKVVDGKLTFWGNPKSTKQGRALEATLAEARKAGATQQEIIASISQPAATNPAAGVDPASLGSAKADMDHLFGVDARRTKALERIAEGKAWFGNALKAGEFIAKNGLKGTHESVKTGDKHWDVRAKSEVQPVSQPQEQTNGTQAAQAQPQQTQPETGADTGISEPAAGAGVAGPTEAIEKPSLRKAQAKRVADKQEEAPTVESVAKAIQQKVASNRRKYREKSRKEREAKGYAPNSTPESEQADYDSEIRETPGDRQQKSAEALLGNDPLPLIDMFVNGNFEASEDIFKEITGVRIRGLSAKDKKAALYKWAKWTPEQIAQAEQSASDKDAARSEKLKQDDLKSAVMGSWLALGNLQVGETKVSGTETGQEFVIRTIASGFDKAHSQKKGVATIYGLTNGKSFTTLKNGALTKFVKSVIAFGGLDKAMEYVNPPKPQAPAGFKDRSIETGKDAGMIAKAFVQPTAETSEQKQPVAPADIAQPATKTVAQPTEKTSDQAPKAEQSQTQPEAGKAAADIQPAAGPGVGDAQQTGDKPKSKPAAGVNDLDGLEAALRKERDSTTSEIESGWMDGKGRRQQTAIEGAVYDAVTASVLDADAAAGIVETALKEGRPDLALYAAKRAARAAESMSTTPGVSESSPKYEAIKNDLVKRKQKAQADAKSLLEKVTKVASPATTVGMASTKTGDTITMDAKPTSLREAIERKQNEPTTHAGLKIYPIKIKVGDKIEQRWGVQTPRNAEREKNGERQIGGDPLSDTLDGAKKLAEQEVATAKDQQERSAAHEAEAAAAQAKKDANKGKSILQRRADALLDKQHTYPPQAGLGQGTRREAMQKSVDQGRAIVERMVLDTAAKHRDQTAIDLVRARGYILGLSNENIPVVKQGLEAQARMKANQYEKPEYRVYDSAKTDGGFYEITKTEFDYAKSLEKADKAARQAAPNDMNEADANIQNGNATRELSSFMKNERDAATRSEKVAEWRKQYSGDHAETIAAGDISRSDYEKLADLVRRGGVTEQRAVEMIESSVSAGVLDRFVADNMKKKVAAQQGTPTHQDPGEKPEAATAPVIAQSLAKAARKEDHTQKEMRLWLVGEIDKAVKLTEDYSDYQESIKKNGQDIADSIFFGKHSSSVGLTTPQGNGTITFDVPGDGKFKIRNSLRGLMEFRAKVEAKSGTGFTDKPTKAKGLPASTGVAKGSSNQIEALSSMLEELDFGAAVDYARETGVSLNDAKISKEVLDQFKAYLKDGTEPKQFTPSREWNYQTESRTDKDGYPTRGATLTKKVGADEYKAGVTGTNATGFVWSITKNGKTLGNNGAPPKFQHANLFVDALKLAEDAINAIQPEVVKPKDTGWNMAGVGFAGKRYRGRNITLDDGREVVARIYENAGKYEDAEVKVDGVSKFRKTDRYKAEKLADDFIRTLTAKEAAPAKAPIKVTPQVSGNAEKFIKVAADSVDKLRQVDVERVLSETPVQFRAEVSSYIKSNRDDLVDEVDAVLADLNEPAQDKPAESKREFRNPDNLNVLHAPIEDKDWFKLKNGEEWQARQGYSGRGWSLVRDGSLHPEARNFESQADFIRSVIEVTQQTQAPGQVAAPAETNDEPIPAVTEAQARKQFEWRNMGQKDGTKSHLLFFFESEKDKGTGAAMNRGEVSLYPGASGWKVEDGDGTSYKSLADAKKAAIDLAIPKLQDQGYILKPAAEATAILDAANVTGKERIEALKDVKKGDITPEELQAAYPAKDSATFPNTTQGAIDAFNADDSTQAVAIMAKLKLDDLKEVGGAIGFRPQIGENAKAFRERIGAVADKLTLTNRKQTANEMKLHTRLTKLASDYDRAIAHRDRAIANGAEAGSSAFEGQYEGQWTTIDKGLAILENALQEESKSPDYAKVSAMVKEARPAIFDAAKPDDSVKPEAKPYDAARAQELKNDIEEGESILRAKSNNGRKYSADELAQVQRSVDSSKAKLAALDGGGMQFSRTTSGTPTLIIQHNLTEENLLHADRMGGIPVPSLAITQAEHPLVNFGEITLVGGVDMANPKGYAATKVFGADIYSPRYPRVTFSFTANMKSRGEAMLKDALKATDSRIEWSEVATRGADELRSNPAIRWQVLTDNGIKPEIIRTEAKPLPKAMEPFANDNRFSHELAQDPAFIEAAYKAHEVDLVRMYDGDAKAAQEELAQLKERANERGVSYLVRGYANDVQQHQRDTRSAGAIDRQATNRAMEVQIEEAGLRDKLEVYSKEYLRQVNPDEKLFQGFTNMGNRKYIPHTLDNVIKILKKDMVGGEGFNYGVGSVRSRFTPQFKSIAEIQKAKGRLMDEKAFDLVKEEVNNELSELSNALRSYHDASEHFGFGDTVTSTLSDSAKMGLSRALTENGFKDVPQEVKEQIAEFLGKLRNMPTAYFEAKILRAVDVSEFKGAVVPTGTSQKAIDALARRGITNIKYYDKSIDGDRAAKIQELAKESDLLFSRANTQNPTTVQALQSAIRDLVGAFGGNKLGRIVATTAADIKSTWEPLIGKTNLESEGNAGKAQAFYDPKTNTVFLIADHIEAGNETAVLAHELMHKWGKQILGEAGWNKLHSVISNWADAKEGSQERQVYDQASAAVDRVGVELSSEELFPYAVEAAIKMGIKPNMMTKPGTVTRWLAEVRNALKQVWEKIIGKPDTFKAQDLVNLAFGIAQMENPELAAVGGFKSTGQTDTPAFRKWFGDSKVVDADGKPLVVYHGTGVSVGRRGEFMSGDFDTFDAGLSGKSSKTGAPEGSFFFTDKADVASSYTVAWRGDFSEKLKDGANVMPVYITMRKPLKVNAKGENWREILYKGEYRDLNEIVQLAKDSGKYDGVIVAKVADKGVGVTTSKTATTYVAFNPTQIKSATGNNGDFDAENPDIRFSRSLGDTLASATNSVRDVALPAGYKVNDLIGSVPGKLNWWHRSVGTMYNLAQRSAPFKRVFDSVQTFINDVSYYATEAADLAPNILPKLETWKDIAKSPLSAADTKAISAPIFEGTLIWARDESGKPVKVETLEAAAAQLTPEQKAQRLLRGDHISQQVLKMWQGLPVDQFETIINGKYERDMLKAGVVWTDAELKSIFNLTDKQIPLYREFRKATDKSLTNLAIADMLRFGGEDVMPIREQVLASKDVSEASETLRDYLLSLTDIDPDRADVLTDTADKMIEKGDRAKDLIDRGYAPLSRFGQYTLDVVHDGERVYFSMFESKWEAARMNRQMQAEYPGAKITQGTVSEQAYKMFAGVSPETLELFGDMLGLEAQGDDASAKAFQEYLKLAKSSRSAMKRLIHRKGIAGFNEDAGRVLAGFVYSNARQTASSLHMGEMTNAANDISQTQGELKDAAVKLVDYIKNPQEEAQKLRGLLFAQYIGGSVASAMVNMTQPLTMTFPWLSQYGGVASAAKQMTAAMKDSGKKLTGDAKLDAALHRAEEDGTVSPQEVHQLLQQSMGKGALQSGDGTTAGNAMATANNTLSRFSLGWGKLFSVAEQFNRRVTFIAAYRTAVTQGMADPDAFARKAVAETQGIYNRGNKPQWARGALGSTLFTFKQYSIAYVEMLSRMAKAGKPGSKERAQGQKAALLALGVLFLMSGAGGMPGADDLDDLISGALQALGYNFDSKARRKEFFVSLFGEGGAQFVERGVSGLPGVPIDVSGRMGLGNLVPGTGLFTKKTDHTRDVAELAGPAGDLAKRTFEAAGKLIKGDAVGSAVSVSPKAFQNLHQAYDMANMGMYRDASGKKVVDTDGYDAIAKAIGFQPTDVKRIQDASIEVQRMIGLNKMRESEIADKWALGMFEKNPAKVEDARNDLKTWNADNPSSPIRINFGQIIKRVQKMNETKTQRIAKTAPREIRETVRRELATQ